MWFLPAIQNNFHINAIEPLHGDAEIPQDPEITRQDWFSTKFQGGKEAYLNSNFGFREALVRFNNQIAFTVFKKAKANGVIIGNENYLYEKNYISAYTGKDYLGEKKIAQIVARIKFISDTLNKLNKKLLIVFAPGKATFFPEYIPLSYGKSGGKTNYNTFQKTMSGKNISVIDFNKWFKDNKEKSVYPLYPKYGIHWSVYGSALAGDSILKKIGTLCNAQLPAHSIKKINILQPYDTDYDIADGMNLIERLEDDKLAYPEMFTDTMRGNYKPKVLVVADSFYWTLYKSGFTNSFAENHFWYYNKLVYPQLSNNPLFTEELDYNTEIKNHDVFIVMATEANLPNFGWGFFEDLEHHFRGDNYLKEKNQKFTIRKNILNNKVWMNDIETKARKKNITTDSMVTLDMIWVMQHPK